MARTSWTPPVDENEEVVLWIHDNGRMAPDTVIEVDLNGNQVGQVRFLGLGDANEPVLEPQPLPAELAGLIEQIDAASSSTAQ